MVNVIGALPSTGIGAEKSVFTSRPLVNIVYIMRSLSRILGFTSSTVNGISRLEVPAVFEAMNLRVKSPDTFGLPAIVTTLAVLSLSGLETLKVIPSGKF